MLVGAIRGIDVNPGGWGSRPPDFGQGSRGGGAGGALTGHKILVYLFMYRKYVRKW